MRAMLRKVSYPAISVAEVERIRHFINGMKYVELPILTGTQPATLVGSLGPVPEPLPGA